MYYMSEWWFKYRIVVDYVTLNSGKSRLKYFHKSSWVTEALERFKCIQFFVSHTFASTTGKYCKKSKIKIHLTILLLLTV
jgi:hypothetical protein